LCRFVADIHHLCAACGIQVRKFFHGTLSMIVDSQKSAILTWLSLTPGFSRVAKAGRRTSRFNGLPARKKPLKRF
jgi:hypothetical protein